MSFIMLTRCALRDLPDHSSFLERSFGFFLATVLGPPLSSRPGYLTHNWTRSYALRSRLGIDVWATRPLLYTMRSK